MEGAERMEIRAELSSMSMEEILQLKEKLSSSIASTSTNENRNSKGRKGKPGIICYKYLGAKVEKN